jgi:hypothetical protein
VSPITSCRLSVAVAMSLQICNGKQSRKRRSKTEAKETAGGSRIRSVNKRVQQKELKIKWLDEPEEHDYPAAESYLKLLFDDKTVAYLLESLKRNPIIGFKAKDIFRASGLSLLGISNSHVEKDLRKIREGTKLSPLLLVRDRNTKVIIADGYHRLCAVYSVDEDAMIPCKIV